MQKNFLGSAVCWFLFVLTVTLVMRWLARSRLSPSSDRADDSVLENPAAILLIGVVSFVFFGTLAILSFLLPVSTPKDQWTKTVLIWTSPFTLAFVTMGGYLIAQYFRERHRLEPTRLTYRTVFKSGTLRWDEVQSVYYSSSLKWFRIQTNGGAVVRVTIMLKNLPAFARCVLANVSPSCIDAATNLVLNATASGDLP